MQESKGVGIEFTRKMMDTLKIDLVQGSINRPLTYEEQVDIVKSFRLLLQENRNLKNNRTQEVDLALLGLKNELFMGNKDKIDQLTKQFREQIFKKDQMLQDQASYIQKLLVTVYTLPSIQQNIVSDNTNHLIKQFEQEYEKIYKSYSDLGSQLQQLCDKKEEQNFLQSQEKVKEERKFIEFDQIQAKFQESIQCLAKLIKKINNQVEAQELDEQLKVTLKNMNLILSHNLKIFKNSLELFKQANQDQRELIKKNQKLVEENQKLEKEINTLIEEHIKSVEQMKNKFNESVQKYQDVLSFQRIGSNFPQQELSALSCKNKLLFSERSLMIHQEFLQSISKDLKGLEIDIIKATLNNILLLCKDDRNRSRNHIQVILGKLQKELELDSANFLQSDFLEECIFFLERDPFLNNEQLEFNQPVLLQLQKYNQTILEGEKKLKDEHSKLQH